MDFNEQLKQFANRVESLKDTLQTEEATKTSIIMPFFQLLGYDVFNPNEFVPEYVADVGIKKGEKVDYAILIDGTPIILIEAKWIGEPLERHDSQLFRYFGTTKAKFAILTNGLIYRFFTDLEEPNKMDERPFFEFNISDIRDAQIAELKRFQKASLNVSEILDIASDLKYSNEIKKLFSNQLQSPDDDFVKYFLSRVYGKRQTQAVIDRFRDIIKKTLANYINELMSDKIKNALETNEELEDSKTQPSAEAKQTNQSEKNIETTEEELEAYFIVKNILADYVDIKDIIYKDNYSYMCITYKGMVTRWICRFYFNYDSKKFIAIPDESKKEIRFEIQDIYEINKFKDQLVEVLKRYIKA